MNDFGCAPYAEWVLKINLPGVYVEDSCNGQRLIPTSRDAAPAVFTKRSRGAYGNFHKGGQQLPEGR
jgi:hypothetical protein